jgi:aspartate carbamoyltransferase regulatory subunit
MQIQKMEIGYMKWFDDKLKVKCPYCGKEFTFTLKEISYGFLYPESIKCKFCDNFIELKDGTNNI